MNVDQTNEQIQQIQEKSYEESADENSYDDE